MKNKIQCITVMNNIYCKKWTNLNLSSRKRNKSNLLRIRNKDCDFND